MDVYAVVGDPVEQSKSPQIHTAFGRQLQANLTYDKHRVEAGQLAKFVADFAGAGLNVTVPLKLEACALADQLDPYASHAGAVNTLKLERGTQGLQVHGYNTDGIGLVRDLSERVGMRLQGLRVLLLGAGGASQGVLLPLLEAGIAHLTIANRTPAKAQAMAAGVAPRFAGRVAIAGLADAIEADLVINATSLGLQHDDQLPFHPHIVQAATCYDMSYGAQARFMRWARQMGAPQAVDGLGMLVEQAAQSFYIWRGETVQTQAVYEMLRADLDG